jgi:hypothetical protein
VEAGGDAGGNGGGLIGGGGEVRILGYLGGAALVTSPVLRVLRRMGGRGGLGYRRGWRGDRYRRRMRQIEAASDSDRTHGSSSAGSHVTRRVLGC